LAEYIAQEEMGRCRGYWWSPDSRQIAFIEADETHIPIYHIVHQGKAMTGAEAEEQHRYPFAGAANARVRLGVLSLGSGEIIWMDLGEEEDIYLARVDWLPDGFLSAQIENRRQTQLRLVRYDPRVGIGELVFEESSSTWINLNDLFKPLKDGRFLWGSERDGYRHLYLYEKSGG
jgi:dipeptidyl-peptidase 4